jgi:hypothetical protein
MHAFTSFNIRGMSSLELQMYQLGKKKLVKFPSPFFFFFWQRLFLAIISFMQNFDGLDFSLVRAVILKD